MVGGGVVDGGGEDVDEGVDEGEVVWLFGCVVVLLLGCVAVWLFHCVVVWLRGCIEDVLVC